MTDSAAILIHYFKALAAGSGLRWTPANSADIQRAIDALFDDDQAETIPPYNPATTDGRTGVSHTPTDDERRTTNGHQATLPDSRYTVVLDLEKIDPAFAQWRRERAAAEQAAEARRLLQREERL
jgi:hypothetical protein